MMLQDLQKLNKLFIGVLSGTSMNSIDAILVDFTDHNYSIISTINYRYNKKLVSQLLSMINLGACKLQQLGSIDHLLGLEFSKCVQKLLSKVSIDPKQVTAIGLHGQTIWHAPNIAYPFSMQIGDPNIVCATCKILTVADFRRKDMAFGGQGAPLAPGFHAAMFSSSIKTRAIINIGGISNVTILPKNHKQPVIGFDLGPGNCLMDEWVQTKFKKLQINYDHNGLLASQGQVIIKLLNVCLKDRYFKQLPPKSTGREYFNQAWLRQKIKLAKLTTPYKNKDILATLLYLTATVISNHIKNIKIASERVEEVYICGGGANNKALLDLLKHMLNCPVSTTMDLGIHPDWVEAALFAWLAKQTVEQRSGNLPDVTGAKSKAILGAIYLPENSML